VSKIKIGKTPDHWPYAPPEQQYEGFKSMVDSTSMTIWEFEESMRVLVRAKYMSKSHMHKLIKWFRKIRGISYQEYLSQRNKTKIVNHIPRGLWW